MIKNKAFIYLFLIFISSLAIASYYFNQNQRNLEEVHRQLDENIDSLNTISRDYNELKEEYSEISKKLETSSQRLLLIREKLDTMTSYRMTTFTEVQAKLIELKLNLSNIEVYEADTNSFRFE